MNNQDKQTELKRLHDLVFEGAPEWAKWAALQDSDIWWLFRDRPAKIDMGWVHKPSLLRWLLYKVSASQPETTLDWTETLIMKNSYE